MKYFALGLLAVSIFTSSVNANENCQTTDRDGYWHRIHSSGTVLDCILYHGKKTEEGLLVTKGYFLLSNFHQESKNLFSEVAGLFQDKKVQRAVVFENSIFHDYWNDGDLNLNRLVKEGVFYTLRSLSLHCNKFRPIAVARSPCGLQMSLYQGSSQDIDRWKETGDRPPRIRDVSWPKDLDHLPLLPSGLIMRNTKLEGIKAIRLADVIIKGNIEVSSSLAGQPDFKISLNNCIVIGDVVVRNMKSVSLQIDKCVIFGSVTLEKISDGDVRIMDSGVLGDLIIRNVEQSRILWFEPVDILGNLTIENVRLPEDDFLSNIYVGGSFTLHKVDEGRNDGKLKGISTRDVDVKGKIRITESKLVRRPPLIRAKNADVEIRDVQWLNDQ